MTPLVQLNADIEARVSCIRTSHEDWLCRRGCDGCCRRLAEIPLLTWAEWECLREGLSELPPERLEQIGQAIAALAENAARPIVCPLLDQVAGACQVYASRPVACRTYGFYVQRGVGLYCKDIENQVANGELADVMWGNHDSIDRRLKALGEVRSLTDWFLDARMR